MHLEQFVYFVLVVVCRFRQKPREEFRLSVCVTLILLRRFGQKTCAKKFPDDFLSLSWVVDVNLVILFADVLITQLFIWSLQLAFVIWSRFILVDKFFFKLWSFHIKLMLVHRVVNLICVLPLLVKVYLSSNFSHQVAFSSLSLGFCFFDDDWFFLSWVGELPWGGNAGAIKRILFGFSNSSWTFVCANWWLFTLSSSNLIQFPFNSFFIFLSEVTSIILLAVFFKVFQFNNSTTLYLSKELADNSIHLLFSNNIFRALCMSTNVRWRSVCSITMMSRFWFGILLLISHNEEIRCKVILNLIIKQSFSILHHPLFLLIFGVQKLLLLKLCKAIILSCLSNLRQHLKLIGDVDLLLFEFDLSSIDAGPLLHSYGCRWAAASSIALRRDELNRLVWIHFGRTSVLLAAFLICNWQLFNFIQGDVHHWRKTRTLLHNSCRFHFSNNETSTCLLFFEFTHELVGLIKFSLFLCGAIIGFGQRLTLITHTTVRWLHGWNHWCLFC